jgi:DNA primase
MVAGIREMNIFEMLRERIDLSELAGHYTELKPCGQALVGCCPHPDHEDESPSFHIYDRRFHCYGCRWHGDVTDLWSAVRELKPGMEAALDLAREFGVDLPTVSAEVKEKAERRRNLEADYLARAQEHHAALSRHPNVTQWWKSRGFDEGFREKFLLGVAGAGAAATIPFWSRGRVHGIVRRKLEGEPKYILPEREDFPAGYRPLFIPGRVREGMFLVEGYVDALALSALGYGVAAVGGTHPNREQLAETRGLPGPIYVLPDADEEGEKAARRLVEDLYPKAMLCPPEYERKEKEVEPED